MGNRAATQHKLIASFSYILHTFYREYLTIYPEYSCIFVGDNGQGDVRTAELVLSDEEFGKNLQRVYVHQVGHSALYAQLCKQAYYWRITLVTTNSAYYC